MSYKTFATDKLNSNTILLAQTFDKVGNNLIVKETFTTTLNPDQVIVLQTAYNNDKNDEMDVDMNKVNAIQADLDAISQIYS